MKKLAHNFKMASRALLPAVCWLISSSFTTPKEVLGQPTEPIPSYSPSEVEIVPAAGLNSASLDFSPILRGNWVIFTSNRNQSNGNKFDKKVQIWCTDLWMAERKGFGQYGAVSLLPAAVNTKWHDGTAVFNPAGSQMIFARNIPKPRIKNVLEMHLFEAKTAGEQAWEPAKELKINVEGYNSCQPTISADGKWLFFASNRPGGLGGMDIWAAPLTMDGWGQPFNLGPAVNSAANDIFPCLAPDGNLYFSSNREGSQGLDIYYSKSTNYAEFSSWAAAMKLGEPFNSTFDDFSYIVNADGKTGFLSSNRSDGRNDDIYEWKVKDKPAPAPKPAPVFALEGSVHDGATNAALGGAEITLLNRKTNETIPLTSDAAGRFTTPVECSGEYLLTVKKNGYVVASRPFSTTGKNCEESFTQSLDVALVKETPPPVPSPAPAPNVAPEFREVKVGAVIRLNNIRYDLAKWNIRPDAAVELDKVVYVMKQYPSMEIELSSHTDCRGSSASNETLSQKRAESARNYILTQGGFAPTRITAVGMGERQLLNHCFDGVNCSEAEHQENRRTEIRVLKLDDPSVRVEQGN